MNATDVLEGLTKDELVRLMGAYVKNLLAIDGVWFQAVEAEEGMDAAMRYDVAAWERFSVTEGRRLKTFLGLPDRSGLEGLARALPLKSSSLFSEFSCDLQGDRLIFRIENCKTQQARAAKGLPYHPCKAVGQVEYEGLASVIDERIVCRCLSCYPDVTDDTCSCAWEFTLVEDAARGEAAADGAAGEGRDA